MTGGIGAAAVSRYDAAPKLERTLKGHTKRFRYIAIAEGLSYLILLFIAMPLKYGLDMPLAVRIVGSAHGALFIAYLLFGHLAAQEQRWTIHYRVWVIVASLIPFATFVVDRQLKEDAVSEENA